MKVRKGFAPWQPGPVTGGSMLSYGPFQNSILRALDRDVIGRLGLHPVQFEVMHEIEFPGKTVARLYFVETGMASMTTTFTDGSQVEVGTFGYESMIGVSGLMGTRRSLNRVYTQIAGHGYVCPLEAGRAEFDRTGAFQRLALRYVQAQLVQAMQSAACNAKHEVDQRLARWLLICADRAHSNTFRMSQEFLSEMLGSTRPSVSLAAGVLKDMGLVRYTRGMIEILDVAGLEGRACECYRVIRDHLDDALEFEASIAY
jgi:CRP-like cAMP-binding protein